MATDFAVFDNIILNGLGDESDPATPEGAMGIDPRTTEITVYSGGKWMAVSAYLDQYLVSIGTSRDHMFGPYYKNADPSASYDRAMKGL